MSKSFSLRTALQNALLLLYRRSRQSRFIRSPIGRRLFENAYLTYKVLLEAGPIGKLKPLVTPGSWTVDVGANIGLFTLRFARWVSDGGHVIAIEPEAINFSSLQRRLATARQGRHVIAIQAAAADAAGILHLNVNPDHPGDHRLGISGVPTSAVTLDAVLAEHGNPQVSLVKIDVQGAELRVLKGASATLKRCRPALFIEIDDAALRNQGSTAEELIGFLSVRGYRPYSLRRFHSAKAIALSDNKHQGYEDILFLNEAHDKLAP